MLFSRVLRRIALRLRSAGAIRQLALFLGLGVVLALLFSGRLQEQILAATGPAPLVAEPPAVMATPGTLEAEIQNVILRANREQEQAIATKNSAVMRDTSTDGYYQEMVQTNNDMLGQGITSIKLTRIEWGEISIDGNSARATTWETWQTDVQDGRSVQSRDRNVYALVKSGGAWRINSDDHPDNGPQLPSFFP